MMIDNQYQRGNAALIAWLEYIAIPLAFLYQVFVFDDVPGQIEGIGASLTLVGCLLPGVHEMILIVLQKKRQEVVAEADPEESYQRIIDDHDGYCYSLGPGANTYISESEFDSEPESKSSLSDSGYGDGRSTVLV